MKKGIFCHSDFTWNQCWSFWSPKNCHFWLFEQFWILNFSEFLTFSSVKFPKTQNLNPSKLLKQQIVTLWYQQKLISPENIVAGKLLNFHTVECPQSKFPIRLPRSVSNNLHEVSCKHTYWNHTWYINLARPSIATPSYHISSLAVYNIIRDLKRSQWKN